MTKLSNADRMMLKNLKSELNDVDLEIYRLETVLEKLRAQRAKLKEQQRLLNNYGKLIPAVIRDWWQR